MNYWGDEHMGQQDDATEVNQEDFSWTGGTAIVVGDVDDVDRDPDGNATQNGDILDGIEELDLAKSLMADGDYEGAFAAFKEVIAGDPSSGRALTAVEYLLRCCYYGGLDYYDLRDYLVDLADDQAEETPYFSWIARRYGVRSLVWAGDKEQAVEEYRNLLEYTPSEAESLTVEMDIAMLEEELAFGETDASQQSQARMSELENRFFAALEWQSSQGIELPAAPSLLSAFPNPFNGSVQIRFVAPGDGRMSLAIYDLLGREVTRLLDSESLLGRGEVLWDASQVPSGIYCCEMRTLKQNYMLKLLLVR